MKIVITTVDTKEKAREIARKLVQQKLASCVSIFNVESTYMWENQLWEGDQEYMLLIKTIESKVPELIKWLEENHPYKVPEIVTIEANAHGKYLKWITDYLKS